MIALFYVKYKIYYSFALLHIFQFKLKALAQIINKKNAIKG